MGRNATINRELIDAYSQRAAAAIFLIPRSPAARFLRKRVRHRRDLQPKTPTRDSREQNPISQEALVSNLWFLVLAIFCAHNYAGRKNYSRINQICGRGLGMCSPAHISRLYTFLLRCVPAGKSRYSFQFRSAYYLVSHNARKRCKLALAQPVCALPSHASEHLARKLLIA